MVVESVKLQQRLRPGQQPLMAKAVFANAVLPGTLRERSHKLGWSAVPTLVRRQNC